LQHKNRHGLLQCAQVAILGLQ